MRGATQFGASLREQLRLALRISGRLFALLGAQCVEAREVRLTEELQLRAVGGRALRPALRLSHLRLELLYLHPHPHLAGMTLHLLVAHARARLVDTRALRRHLRLRILQLAEALLRLLEAKMAGRTDPTTPGGRVTPTVTKLEVISVAQ